LAGESRTIVLFEAPHRLGRTLADLQDVLGADRQVVVARELTKLHEEVWRGTLGEAVARVAEVEPRGEHVLVVAGAPPASGPSREAVEAAVGERLAAGRSVRDAAAEVSELLGVARRQAYDIAVRLRRKDPPD
jgi:16S rRNA (cytidine1402-2'-O)-methyltransferase